VFYYFCKILIGRRRVMMKYASESSSYRGVTPYMTENWNRKPNSFIEHVIDYKIHVVHSAIRVRARIRWGDPLNKLERGSLQAKNFFVKYPMTQLS